MTKMILGPESFKFKESSGPILPKVLTLIQDYNSKLAKAKESYEKSLSMLKANYEEEVKTIETQTEKDLMNV